MNEKTWNMYLNMRSEGARDLGDLKQGHRKYTLDDFETWMKKNSLARNDFKDCYKKMLIIGCGDGCEVDYMIKLGFDAFGIDFDDIKFGRYPKLEGRMMKMDMHEINLSGNYDIIYTSHAVEHAISPYIVFCQMNRMLRTGGLAYISMPRHTEIWVNDPQHLSVLTELQAVAMAEKTGFHMKEKRTTMLPVGNPSDASQIFILEKMYEVLDESN